MVSDCGTWEGTHADLLAQINALSASDRRDPQWPKSGRAMSAVIARAESNLTVAGIKFARLQREARTGVRRIWLQKMVTSSPTSPSPALMEQEVTV
jgi:hypothetical protein